MFTRRIYAVAIAVAGFLLVGAAFALGAPLTGQSTAPSVPGTTVSTMTSPATTPTSVVVAPREGTGTSTFDAGEGGTVTLTDLGDRLIVDFVTPAAGWEAEIKMAMGREVEAKFAAGLHRIDFNAAIEDGELRVRVRDRNATGQATSTTLAAQSVVPSSDSAIVEAGPAGSVEVAVVGGRLVLVDIRADNGWTYQSEFEDGDEIEVKFVNGSSEVEVEVELENGDIRSEVEIETADHDDDDGDGGDHEDDDDNDDVDDED